MSIFEFRSLSANQLEEKVKRMEALNDEENVLWYRCQLYQAAGEYEKVPPIAKELIKKYECSRYKGYLAAFYVECTQDEQNWEEAIKIFEQLAEIDQDSVAMYMLGFIYEKGKGSLNNKNKALSCYRMSASLDNARAVLAIGYFYQEGWSVKQDYLKALEHYLKAYEMGLINAITHIIAVNIDREDYTSAIKWANVGIAANNSDAMMLLGTLYHKGFGVRKSWKRACELYKQSADMENGDAQLLYYTMLMEGKGVPKNIYKAQNYLHRAAMNGNETALSIINNFYDHMQNGILAE
jgi:TPR repeat protein